MSTAKAPIVLEQHLDMTLREWIEHYQHEIVTRDLSYRGVPILKQVLDLWIYLEIIHETKPDVIVEIGAKYGGSILGFADVLGNLTGGRVVSIDLERPQIDLPDNALFVAGNSVDAGVVDQVRQACGDGRVMVIADGDHSAEHVLQELRSYAPLVTEGCYFVVEDGIVDVMKWEKFCPGPAEAVKGFLAETNEFEADRAREKFIVTYNPGSFLRRTSPPRQ